LISELEGQTKVLAQSVLLALAAGTFIYIGLVEMLLIDVFQQKKRNVLSAVLHGFTAMLGFGFMSSLALWV
jgi:hypothetical protein